MGKKMLPMQKHTLPVPSVDTTIEQKAQVSAVWVGAGWMVEAG